MKTAVGSLVFVEVQPIEARRLCVRIFTLRLFLGCKWFSDLLAW
jgi:hypothetical protein